MQRGFLPIIALILIGGVLLGGIGGWFYLWTQKDVPDAAPTTPSNQPFVTSSPISQAPPSPLPSASVFDETNNWKVYRNEIMGFEIKYPTDRFVRWACPGEGLTLLEKTSENADQEGYRPETCGRGGHFPIEASVPNYPLNELRSDQYTDVKEEDVIVAGNTIKKYTLTPASTCVGICDWTKISYIRIPYKGKTIQLVLAKEELSSIFEKMLTTFKFIN